ncbi:ASKHA domain-containing protein [Acidaminobacter sp.]|uniref:ASKHA domain-containing protein n=1 Tax=Acidaminobacter sp. TaxID=1872102 RepID=UPI00137EC488|nr:ASKHA domain-containing protein [Acidaminobacter sp.]MDK9711912.1 ASKHA domain-containing protein [Acidaminobacter sp.]MZQ97309.1 DUF4445 domain-containing protein [Acidaminobacter sp.]
MKSKLKKIQLIPDYEGELVSDIIQRLNVGISLPCAGNHTCGKCKVLIEGSLSEVKPSEAAMLSATESDQGVRMACFVRAFGEFTIYLPEKRSHKILTQGTTPLMADRPLMPPYHYGIAVDIGTTTVVCTLFDTNANVLGTVSALNQQKHFGADVISRINYGIQNGNEGITRAIVQQIEDMIDQLALDAQILRTSITNAVVTGNTTMLHFFSGLDPRGIGFAPFIPKSFFDHSDCSILKGIDVYMPSCVSAYVGADLVCCILASDMMEKNDTALIVDIGTNGEMALVHNGELHCCSTAAGPAFEGAGISCGMTASEGAIAHVHFDDWDDKIVFETIDSKPPAGICGSGVVDTISLLYMLGAISPSGRIEPEGHKLEFAIRDDEETEFVFPESSVTLTQGDIRNIQLAKAAIHAGILTLTEACGISLDEIDVLYLCGGFGSFVNLSAAENIGLIPLGTKDRTVVLGNGAIMGASKILLGNDNLKHSKKIAQCCNYIELSGNDVFMDHYILSMPFGEMEED